MRIHPFYVKLVGETLIPVLGFFAWNWSLYFILLFYLMDLAVAEVVLHLKTRKIKSYNEKVVVHQWMAYGLYSGLLLLTIAAGVVLGSYFLHPGMAVQQETLDFLSYEEMGVAQGYILLPLLIFMAYASYQTEFIRLKAYQYQDYHVLWRKHLTERGLVLLLALLLTASGKVFGLNDQWMLLLLLAALVLYKVLEARRAGVFH